ncbi:Rv3654c family TadE-like protein [Streptomyces sp. NPDC057757]|uniref:Rv3654c family TadE-like protein n=1 Tax=Streptomyces sp. NPDC057757 TaxID=3346241 RepID=UPI0036B1DA4A
MTGGRSRAAALPDSVGWEVSEVSELPEVPEVPEVLGQQGVGPRSGRWSGLVIWGRATDEPGGSTSALALRSATRTPAESDRGSATVWSVGVIAVLCVVFGVVLAMGQVVLVRHRAAGAADLAALAAADHWMDGPTAACGEADRVARAQHARLVRCALGGEISDVTAASGRGPFAAEVRSRAGPAGAVRTAGAARPVQAPGVAGLRRSAGVATPHRSAELAEAAWHGGPKGPADPPPPAQPMDPTSPTDRSPPQGGPRGTGAPGG